MILTLPEFAISWSILPENVLLKASLDFESETIITELSHYIRLLEKSFVLFI